MVLTLRGVFAAQAALLLVCFGCLTHIKVAYRQQKTDHDEVQQLALLSQSLWGTPSPPKIPLDVNPAKMLKLAETPASPPHSTMHDTKIPGNSGGDQGEKTHFLHYNHAPPISKVAGEVHNKLDNTRQHLMAELKRWGSKGEDGADVSAAAPAPASDETMSDKIAEEKKKLAQLKEKAKKEAKLAKTKAKTAKLKAKSAKKEKLEAKKKAQLKALEAKVAAAKQKLAGKSTAKTGSSTQGGAMAQMNAESAKAKAAFKAKMAKWNKEDSADDPLDSNAVQDDISTQVLLGVRQNIEKQLDSAARMASESDHEKLRSISDLKSKLHQTLHELATSQRKEQELKSQYHQQGLNEPKPSSLEISDEDDSTDENSGAIAAATELHAEAVSPMRKKVSKVVLALKSAEQQTNALKQSSAGWNKYFAELPVRAKKTALHSVVKSELAQVATRKKPAKPEPAWKKMLDEQLSSVAKDNKEVKAVKKNVMHGVKGVKHDHNSWDHYFST
jgi:hypothetical protein